ncbi:hypothetical protein [uncultured Aquabacterium sp.]|uniref:hypothetical protein n=1 Tax=Aquabacterium sp. TaxID=1872578 RepID=UPI0025CBF11D|nr:hypothetical protein [uncultured Aquabacterium sp.]
MQPTIIWVVKDPQVTDPADATADTPLHYLAPHVVRTARDVGQMVKRQRKGTNLRQLDVAGLEVVPKTSRTP